MSGSGFKLPNILEQNILDWDQYLNTVYSVFKYDFITTQPKSDLKIQIRKFPISKERENAFWHLVSEANESNPGEENRTIDIERCKRIPWIKPIIEARHTGHVVWWKNTRRRQNSKKSENIIISLLDFSYIVVLSERTEYYLLVSAYPIRKASRRQKLKAEYEEYMESQKAKNKDP